MSIRDMDAYIRNLWDWGILDGCFSGKIAPTDLDGFVEKNGHFLVLETKSPGCHMPIGQELTFKALQKLGKFTIMIVWGKPGSPEEIQLYKENGDITRIIRSDLNHFRRCCEKWYTMALKDIGKK